MQSILSENKLGGGFGTELWHDELAPQGKKFEVTEVFPGNIKRVVHHGDDYEKACYNYLNSVKKQLMDRVVL